MSDRGSILISTANDIGEALVEKLGGEGYAPSVWDKEYNKLGIAEVDSAPALSVLEDSSETGTARGSILMSTANAIGAMLNKKYNTDRGFKPKEWASAASKLAPLPQKSAESASICSIEDGADDVPTKSLIVTIPPTLSGVSSVTETQTGKNLIDLSSLVDGYVNSNGTFNTNNNNGEMRSGFIPVKPDTTYYFSIVETTGTADAWVGIGEYTNNDGTGFISRKSFWRFTTSSTAKYVVVSARNLATATKIQLEVGNDPTTWEAYTPIKQYTASLGRTIYGGTADIVNGTGKEIYKKVVLDGTQLNRDFGLTEKTGYTQISYIPYIDEGIGNAQFVSDSFEQVANISQVTEPGKMWNSVVPRLFFSLPETVTTQAQVSAYFAQNPAIIIYPVATPADFTFTGQEINTRLGYNAFWSDQGNTALDYYGEPEPYTRGTASGAIANVQSARTDLPFTMVKANIAPNLTGVESVEVTKAGKNLFNKENPNEVDGYITTTGFSTSNTSAKTIYIPIVGGATYTVSKTAGQRFSLATAEVIPSNNAVFTGRQDNNTATSISITAGANDKYLWAWIYLDGTDAGTLDDMISSVQIEVGSSATEYTPYEEPTVYTADLGEPVYGGSVDLVSGEKVKTSARLKISDLNWSIQTVSGRSAFVSGQVSNMPTTSPKIVLCDVLPYDGEKTIGGMTDKTLATWTNTFRIYDTDVEDVTELISTYGNGYITYPLVTNIESSITPQVINPSEGVNNLWNNAGGDTDVEYFTQE